MLTRDRTNLYLSYRLSYAHRPVNRFQHGGPSSNAVGRHESTDEEAQGLIAGAYDESGDVGIEMDVLPPRWLDVEDEVADKLETVRTTMKTLDTLHQKHVLPGFDDDAVKHKEEREIEAMTQAITRDFQTCQSRIRRIDGMVRETKQQGTLKAGEETMANNLRISLATRVADVSGLFRKRQTAYLKKMRALGGMTDIHDRPSAQNPYTDPSMMETENDRASAQSTLLQTKQKQRGRFDAIISQREHEIEQIAQGVIDLANIFQEINTMVIDQGTMLDRVDYNVERASTNLQKADKELVKASGYQKKATKRKVILLLILIVVGMIILVSLKPKRSSRTSPEDGIDQSKQMLDGSHLRPRAMPSHLERSRIRSTKSGWRRRRRRSVMT